MDIAFLKHVTGKLFLGKTSLKELALRFVRVLYIFSVLLAVNLCSCKHEHISAGLGSGY